METQETICCPRFEPEPWHNQIVEWHNKTFIRDKVTTLFYMPLNFGAVMTRLDKKVRAAGANIPDGLALSDHTSKWNLDIYVAVDKLVENCEMTQLSGRFFCAVYEGSFKDTGIWCKDFDAKTNTKGLKIEKQYMWYTTCPKCAKKYGKNYVVILGKIA